MIERAEFPVQRNKTFFMPNLSHVGRTSELDFPAAQIAIYRE